LKNILFILNPRAGKLKARSALFDILEIFCQNGDRVTVQMTAHRGHAAELAARGCQDGYDLIVCSGGDGTLNETVNGVLSATAPLPIGYIPAGSTNDFAASIGLPSSLTEAAEAIVNGIPRDLDVGIFNENRHFTYIASFGAFTEASYATDQSQKNALGHLAYVLEGIKDIGSIKPIHAVLRTGERKEEGDFLFGAVSNSTSVGGIVRLKNGMVDMADGLFEVLLIRSPRTPAELHAIVQGIMNSDFRDEIFCFLKADEVWLTFREGLHWSLDGEFADGGREVHIRNMPKAIQLIQ